jgi:hypothetical protein
MPRPHEDIEHHTPVDHRGGGPPIALAPKAWCAIDIVHVTAARVGAGISAYETLIEKARSPSAKGQTAAVLRSANDRRVLAFIELDGHEGFRHVKAAWDDHHLTAQRHAVAESSELALFQVTSIAGDVHIDPGSHDAYAFEHVGRPPQRVRELIEPVAAAPGFRGTLVLGTDDAKDSAIVYRFAHAAEIDAFRASPAAIEILGPVGEGDETFYAVHPVKTFA